MAESKFEEGNVYTWDQLLRQRATDDDQTPLIAYPKTKTGVTDFEEITGRELNRFVDGAAKGLMRAGFEPVYEDTVIGLYGGTDLDYIVTTWALGRLGYTSFLISPRLPAPAVASLLSIAKSTTLLHAPEFETLALATKSLSEDPITILPIVTRSCYDNPQETSPEFTRNGIDLMEEHHRRYMILHSSGSTGLPKLVDYTNSRSLTIASRPTNATGLLTLPFNHGYGMWCVGQAILIRKTMYLFNCRVPQTPDTLITAIRAVGPEILWTVPYALKLLAEREDGIEVLKGCKMVASCGSRTPDDIGDRLTDAGIFVGNIFGMTECSVLFSSMMRPSEDKAWNYLRPLPHARDYLLMKPVEPGSEVCECIVLDGCKGKSTSNSEDPPNSFHTSDMFHAHPIIPDAWKFIGRADDRITLINGEKVLPLPIEGRIVQHGYVREAVMFGVDRPVPGLFLFRSADEDAMSLSDEEFLNRVWPAIMEANSRAEAFSQISREMVVVLGHDVKFPATDKGTFKRTLLYQAFEAEINDAYDRLESNQGKEGSLSLDLPDLGTWLISKFADIGIELDSNSNFFAAGVDSLKAIEMRGLIIRSLNLGGNGSTLPSMVVYDCDNIAKLARYLHGLRVGEEVESKDELEVMQDMIEKYSDLPSRNHSSIGSSGTDASVILTGSTGFLGAHMLSELIESPQISKIFCLIRSSTDTNSSKRLMATLSTHQLLQLLKSPKVIPLAADLCKPDFGLSSSAYQVLRTEVSHIIHCAWTVNFALSTSTFASQLQSLQNLLIFSLDVPSPNPAHLVFCSSIGAALGTPPPATIPSAPLSSLSQASATGYARSKLVAEKILERAAEKGANVSVVRIGQIVPSRSAGMTKLWNPNEAIPLAIRAAKVVGALPTAMGSDDACSWLEVDIIAKGIVKIAGLSYSQSAEGEELRQLVYNLVNPNTFSWHSDLLPALHHAGLDFETVSYSEWLRRIEASEQDMEQNPCRKLLGFWGQRDLGAAGEKGVVRFDTEPTEKLCGVLTRAERVVDGDLLEKIVDAWKQVW